MTKRKTVIITLFVLFLLAAYVAWRFSEPFRPVRTKVPNAQSRVVITYRPDHSGIEQQTFEIYDPEDKVFLFELFGKQHTAVFDTPSCPFGSCFISFAHKRSIISFFPAVDGCGFVRYRGKYFWVTSDETIKLMEICRKFRITTDSES